MVKRFYMRIASQNPWKKAITETNRRREKQTKYNEEHGIVPQALNKKVGELLDIGQGANQKAKANKQRGKMAAEPTALYNAPKNAKEYQQQIKKTGTTNV